MAESMEVISQDDPRFKGIMSKMMGSNVIKRDFGKPFKEEVKKMKSDEEILSNIKKSNERSLQNLRMQMMDDKVANDMFQGGPSRDPKTDADMLAEFIAEDAGKIYDDLPTKERLKFYDRAYNAILRYKRKDPEDMADGGRIGFKKGMDRRTFMKIMGGLTALPVLGKFFKGAKVASTAAPVVKEAVTKAPSYFFRLVDKIRRFGKVIDDSVADPRVERTYKYKDYELKEGAYGDPSETIITKKTDMGPYGYKEESMRFKKGGQTEDGFIADEYEEVTARPDMDGKLKDIEEGIDDASEIIEEATKSAPPIKKASGGLAYMLGE